MRVVTYFGTALAAKQCLDRRVDIENPFFIQRILHAFEQRLIHPFVCQGNLGLLPHLRYFVVILLRRRCNLRQGAPQTFVTDDFPKTQHFWRDRILAQACNVRITALTIKNREHPRPQHIAYFRRVRTGVVQRAIRHPAIK